MSANDIQKFTVDGYNYYIVTTVQKRFIIGGVPKRYKEEYIKSAASCDAVVLLTSKPEFTGGLDAVLDIKPDIEIYGGSAALRNIKAIVNRDINEHLIKDNMTDCGMRFLITPNLAWVDSVMVIYDNVLFSGQAFSGAGTERGTEGYFNDHLLVNKEFAAAAAERLEGEEISLIYPAYGTGCTPEVFSEYRRREKPHINNAVIIYSSEYGYTKSLAEYAADILKGSLKVYLYDVNSDDIPMDCINNSDVLIIGTNTINRNAPLNIWNVITRLDLVNKRQKPYFVFGSFGWAGEGIKLIDKILSDMGMRRAAKPVDVLFKPCDNDFERMKKAVERITEYVNTNSKNK